MQTTTTALIDTNLRWLRRALALLERLDYNAYCTSPPGFAPHRAGAHLRHIVEFYQCFLSGLADCHIDYGARRRDVVLEHSRGAAAAAIRSIAESLESSVVPRDDAALRVRTEEGAGPDGFMPSSISRELQFLSSHTVHHFALIAMVLRLHGVETDAEFGMAPSTLRHLARQGAEAA